MNGLFTRQLTALFMLLSLGAFSQFTHQSHFVEDKQKLYINYCELPFFMYGELDNQDQSLSVKWEALEGEIDWFGKDNFSVEVNDFRNWDADSVIVVRNVLKDQQTIVDSDTISIFGFPMGCHQFQLTSPHIANTVSCGDTIEIFSNTPYDNFNTMYYWNLSGNGRIIDETAEKATIVIDGDGDFYVNYEVSTFSFNNVIDNQIIIWNFNPKPSIITIISI